MSDAQLVFWFKIGTGVMAFLSVLVIAFIAAIEGVRRLYNLKPFTDEVVQQCRFEARNVPVEKLTADGIQLTVNGTHE